MDPCLRRPTGNTYLQYLGAIFKQLLVWLSLHFMVEQLNREPNSPLLECQLCRISKGFIIEKKGEKNMQPAFIYYWLVISKLPHLLQHVNLAKVCSLVFVHGLVAERFKQYLNKGMKISLKGGNEKWQVNKSLKEFRTCAGLRRASLSPHAYLELSWHLWSPRSAKQAGALRRALQHQCCSFHLETLQAGVVTALHPV